MSGGPRLLVLMGSGETAPTMVTPHREIVGRFGGRTPRAVLLDTPYGFQENAADISRRAVDYFAQRVQLPIEVVGFPGPLAVDPVVRATEPGVAALARLRAADLVFAGPGSPSYALSAWRASPVPEALAAKLVRGGVLVFSSAAALTLGRFSLPVYEVYKVGQPPHWLDGLDLLGVAGFPSDSVVIPHYDNAEGGTHDTRYCYMGERRMGVLETLLPETGWILGIDEHTALVLDLEAGTAAVSGRGVLTVRRRGASTRFPAGARLPLRELFASSADAESAAPGTTPSASRLPAPELAKESPAEGSPLLDEVARLEAAFGAAMTGRRAAEAAAAILALDRTITEWAADSLQSAEPDRARAVLRSLVHRLGEAATAGLRDPREVLAPIVESLIALRAELRSERAWAAADRLRDRLAVAGIELRDSPEGTAWVLRDEAG